MEQEPSKTQEMEKIEVKKNDPKLQALAKAREARKLKAQQKKDNEKTKEEQFKEYAKKKLEVKEKEKEIKDEEMHVSEVDSSVPKPEAVQVEVKEEVIEKPVEKPVEKVIEKPVEPKKKLIRTKTINPRRVPQPQEEDTEEIIVYKRVGDRYVRTKKEDIIDKPTPIKTVEIPKKVEYVEERRPIGRYHRLLQQYGIK